jgi:hypothetical protein
MAGRSKLASWQLAFTTGETSQSARRRCIRASTPYNNTARLSCRILLAMADRELVINFLTQLDNLL